MLSSHLLSGLIARDSATQVASRRALLKGLGLGVGASLMSSSMPQKDNLWAFGKIWSGYDEPVIGGFYGLMYARVGNQRMIPLFGYEGTGCLQCKWDPAGFLNIKSRETGYFTDLRTG